MEINKEKRNGITCLKIEGRLDASNSSAIEKDIHNTIEKEGAKIVVDLAKLEYISSAGLRVLLVIAKEIKAKNGKVVLCSMTEGVRKVFEISGFTSIFDIQDNVDAALKKFGSSLPKEIEKK